VTATVRPEGVENRPGERRHWPLVPLGDLCIEAKAGFASGERADDGVIQVRMNNVDTGGHLVWTLVTRVPADPATINQYRLARGDVLFNNTNSTALVGKSALFESYKEPAVFSNHFTRLRPDRARLVPGYLARWLNHEWRRGTFAHICNQWIGQSAVKPAKLLTLQIPLPPLPEQEGIVAELAHAFTAVDAAQRAAEGRLAAAEALPAAYLRDVFERPQTSRWKSTGLGELSRTCSGATPSRSHREYFGGYVPWVKTGELEDGLVGAGVQTEETVTDLALRECSLPLLPVGTLLVAMYGQGQTRGRTGLLAREATTNQACFAILPKPEVFSSEFLQFWFRANYTRLRALTENRGGNQPNLNGVLLRALEVSMPDVAEQRRLATELARRIESAAALIARCREELTSIDAIPASLLRAAFGENS
jgi:restriction endonuclease S subunit